MAQTKISSYYRKSRRTFPEERQISLPIEQSLSVGKLTEISSSWELALNVHTIDKSLLLFFSFSSCLSGKTKPTVIISYVNLETRVFLFPGKPNLFGSPNK